MAHSPGSGSVAQAAPSSALSRPLLALLRLYKRWLSPVLPNACRFSPSCSEYAWLAVVRHGVLRGGVRAAWRLVRCSPLSPGGIDLP